MKAIFGFVKLVAALAVALGIFTVVNRASDSLFTNKPLEEPAYAIAEDDGATAEPVAELSFADLLAQADPAAGERVFKECKACHRAEEGMHAVGPSLYGVVGRAVGTAEGFGYSGALTGKADVWTPEEIDRFITDPKTYAPGTAMTFAGLKKAADRAAVIAYLQTLGQ